jgi:small subunit ribosomal protein S1
MTSEPQSTSDAPEQPAPPESSPAPETAPVAEEASAEVTTEATEAADEQTDEQTNEPTEGESEESSPAPRMKIGSQREGHRPEINRPRVTPPAPPAEVAEPASESASSDDKPAASSDRSKNRRRKGPPEKKPRELPPVAPKTVPTPSVREKLSPELEEELAAALGDASLDEMLGGEKSSSTAAEIDTESRQTVRVVKVHRDDVFVEIGEHHQGIIPLKQFAEPPEPGASVEAIVNNFNGEDGLYELTIPGAAVAVGDWSQVSEGIVVDAVVTGHNKGGLECEVSKLRAFMPISQIALYRVDDIEQFVGEKLTCVVMEANPEKRNLVLSHRAHLEREREAQKEKLMEELAVGQTREGVVQRILDFGAFVDLGGVDGLIPIGQMSWERIKHPSELLTEGQAVKVHVERVDAETGKISLSYRESWENPWDLAAEKYPLKKTFSGTVSKTMDFGAFVKLEAGIEGLIHISELAHHRVFRVADVVSEGQEVEVQVLSVDTDAQRISLSLKALMAKPEPAKKMKDDLPELEEDLEPTLPALKGPLKGGFDRPTGGEGMGLQW